MHSIRHQTIIAGTFHGIRYLCGRKTGLLSASINWSKKHPNLAFVVVLIGLIFIFYLPNFVRGQNLIGQDMDYGIPAFTFASGSFLGGELAFWNPHLFSGTPFYNATLSFLFYPPYWPLLLSPSTLVIESLGALQFFLLGLFTYWLARELGLSPFPSAIASLVFVFSEHTVARLWAGHLNIVETTVMLPLLFLAIHRFAKTGDILNLFLGSLCTALMLVIGFPQTAFYVFIASGLFGLFVSWTEITGWKRIKYLISLLLMILGGVALSAVQLLPTLDLLSRTVRGSGVNYTFATQNSFPPWYLITAIAPDFFGLAPGVRLELAQSVGVYLSEGPLYVGAVALFLAIFGVWVGRRDKKVAFFAFLGAAFLVLALGKYTPIHRLFFDFVPSYDKVRVPARHLVIVVFSLSLLAGWGTQFLWQKREKAIVLARLALGALVILEAFVILGFVLREPALELLTEQVNTGFLAPFLTNKPQEKADLLTYFPYLYDIAIRSLWLPSLLLVGFYLWWVILFKPIHREDISKLALGLLVVGGLLAFDIRLVSWNFKFDDPAIRSNILLEQTLLHQQERSRTLVMEGTLASPFSRNVNAFGVDEGVEIINGYDPIALADYARYLGLITGVEEIGTTDPIFTRLERPALLDLLNVRFIVAGASIPAGEKHDFVLIGQESGVWLYENTHVRPRVYLVGPDNVVPVKDQAAAFDILGKGIAPSDTIIETEGQKSISLVSNPGLDPTSPLENRAFLTAYKNNYVKVEVETPAPGYLVLSDIHYPGWTVYVDGVQQEILRANAIFRAVSLEPGKHIVEFRFFPNNLLLGAAISGTTLVMFLFLAVRQWRRRPGHLRV